MADQVGLLRFVDSRLEIQMHWGLGRRSPRLTDKKHTSLSHGRALVTRQLSSRLVTLNSTHLLHICTEARWNYVKFLGPPPHPSKHASPVGFFISRTTDFSSSNPLSTTGAMLTSFHVFVTRPFFCWPVCVCFSCGQRFWHRKSLLWMVLLLRSRRVSVLHCKARWLSVPRTAG